MKFGRPQRKDSSIPTESKNILVGILDTVSAKRQQKGEAKLRPPCEQSKSSSKWATSSIHESGLSSGKSSRPSVYEEALEMLIASLLVYTFAELRKMARDDKIEASGLMTHPIAISEVMDAINKHQVALESQATSSSLDHDDLRSRLKALRKIQKNQATATFLGRMRSGSGLGIKEPILAQFHDEESTQGVVYGIAVNHMRKRITVAFRGSVSKQDFVTDIKLAQRKVHNPAAKYANDTPSTISIHAGFHEYLFMKDFSGFVRLEHILHDASDLIRENKGYQLYCTGHSLGGALATLCGFYAAVDPKLTKNGPVVVVSIASPRVGNDEFRRAFQALEALKVLQHLRISNEEDIVTLIPSLTMKEAKLSPVIQSTKKHSVKLYKHCGVHLNFKFGSKEDCKDERQLFSVAYARDKLDEEGTLPEDLKRSVSAAKSLVGSLVASKADFKRVKQFHCCNEYEKRLENSRQYLSAITIDHLYADRELVGAVVASRSDDTASSGSFLFRSLSKRR